MAVDSAPNLRLLKAVVIILGIAILVVLGIIVVTVIVRISAADRQEDTTPAAIARPVLPSVAGWSGERALELPPGLGRLAAVESAGDTLILRYEAAGGDTVLVFVDLATGARRGLLRLKRPAD